MIHEQLRKRGIRSESVLTAMGNIPREDFVLPAQREIAYSDQALPIDCQQTISQPYVVALMTEALSLEPHHKVLEIGTGSGYQTAILAELSGAVVSIERHEQLASEAARRLEVHGYKNVEIEVGDGALGDPQKSPYDRIIITAAASHIPHQLWEQLAEGGVLVGPFGDHPSQLLQQITKVDGEPRAKTLCVVRFVPFISAEFRPD
ncbi:MAG: protein-L-isoaspartate(D-aspartate) O-methyltransferase [Pirellulaceae bacterium]|jgi:protein-L-isoaspartate(D-aspartate) O-methyltransferase